MKTTRHSAKHKTPMTLISLELPTALVKAIDREAHAEELTRSAHIRRILKARRVGTERDGLKVINE